MKCFGDSSPFIAAILVLQNGKVGQNGIQEALESGEKSAQKARKSRKKQLTIFHYVDIIIKRACGCIYYGTKKQQKSAFEGRMAVRRA